MIWKRACHLVPNFILLLRKRIEKLFLEIMRICFSWFGKARPSTYKSIHSPVLFKDWCSSILISSLLTTMCFQICMLLDPDFIASRNSFNNSMESSQWNKISYDLEILILTRLPILDLRRLSLTCKYFHSILLDPSFSIHYDRRFLDRPMLFLDKLWSTKCREKRIKQKNNILEYMKKSTKRVYEEVLCKGK